MTGVITKTHAPSHYLIFGPCCHTQAIDIIRDSLSPSEFIGYLKGNCIKYKLRMGDKGDKVDMERDLEKYREYRRWLNEFMMQGVPSEPS